MKKISLFPPDYPDQSAILAAIINTSRDAIISVTLRGIINSWNPAAEKLFGYSSTEIMGKDIAAFIAADWLDEQTAGQQIITSAAFSKQYESVPKRKDGSVFSAAITISNVPDGEGENTGFLVMVRDISGAPQGSDDSKISKAHLQAIFENAEEGFLLVDRNCIIQAFNSKAGESFVLNYKNEVKNGNSLFEYVEENRRVYLQKMTDGVLNGASTWYERSLTGRDGKTYWYHFSLNPVREGQAITGICITGNDITKRKMDEQLAEQREKRFRGMVENSGDAVCILSIEGKPQYISPSIVNVLGYSEQEALELELFAQIHPEDLAGIKNVWEKILTNPGVTFYGNICRVRDSNGSWKWIDGTITNMLHDPAIGGIVDNFRDITERKNSEIAIIELNEQLNNRAKELVKSNEELERFAYVASHDLQEPLRMVGSFLQLLQKKYKAQLDETACQYIEFAVDGAERMKRLILDLLEYSRVGMNKEAMTSVDMNEIVATVLKNFSNKTTESQAIFRIALLPVITANKMQITQLMQNLVSNALKYTTCPVPEIEIGYEEKEDQWQFFIKDNGIGIEKKYADKVFIIFQRLHNKNQYSGTGIGLAICKKIVERHSGTIWIRSEPGQGSTFFFTIKK